MSAPDEAVPAEAEVIATEPIATEEMCRYCFDVLCLALESPDEAAPPPPFGAGISCPLFVTWNKRESDDLRLRGCIGNLSPMPLQEISTFVYKSAFQDHRFTPIEQHELPQLECGVSLLVHYEEAANAYDWEVGKHGILIDFRVGNRNFGATYLPEVAAEQGWDQTETIASLVRKAGYKGRPSTSLVESIRLTRYQSSKWKLGYDDWLPHKGATLA
uniref:AMMECR1 domain-containing protein n=1 Tax=Pinguiococcus pyrenoidosus TaxID=172671 RepID=A0A7R9YEG2_9STRA|mmetsp:Transcript_5023/g.20073  ORF Transcript_5023/g.20073 Transcript_5023/m.20073 type:complete len:216 (+) Transcript_5023:141-788(+)